MTLPRWLDPKTNPALYTAAASLALALWQAIQVQAATGPLTWGQVGRVAAPIVVAALVTWQRGKTTPLADPKDGNGKPLVTAGVQVQYPASATSVNAPAVQPPATTTGPAT